MINVINMMNTLPLEIQSHILSFCAKEDLDAYSLTYKAGNAVARERYNILANQIEDYCRSRIKVLANGTGVPSTLPPIKRIFLLMQLKIRPNEIGFPVSHHMAANFDKSPLFELIKLFGKKIDPKDKFQNTLFHQAVYFGTAKLVGVLIQHQWDIKEKNALGHDFTYSLNERIASPEKNKITNLLQFANKLET